MWPAVIIEFIKAYIKNPTQWSNIFRLLLPVMVLLSIGGQNEIKKEIVVLKEDLSLQITKVEKKIDEVNDKREINLKEDNEWRRDTEGRLSFLEATTGYKKHKRSF